MKTLDYDEIDEFSREARDLIDAGVPFQIAVGGLKAKLLMPLLPVGAGFAVTLPMVALVLGVAALAVLAGVLLYAIHSGRVVEGGGEAEAGPFKGKIIIRVK